MYNKLLLILVCLSIHFGVAAQQQLENAGFENWEFVNLPKDEPTDWSSIKTSDNPITNNAAPMVWDQSTDAHSGNYSVKLLNISTFGVVATGTLTNGRVHADFNPDSGYVYTQPDSSQWNTAFTSKPDSLAGWYKYYPAGNDHGGIRAILHVGEGSLPERQTHDNWIADANFSMPAETRDTWTRFSVPFTYFSDDTPEYILVVIKAGNGTDAVADSYALVDDLQLIYNNSGGIPSENKDQISFYLFDRTVHFLNGSPEVLNEALFRLVDITGQVIFEKEGLTPSLTIAAGVPSGIYLGCIYYLNGVMSRKIYLE
jgi:hypothetical protein